MPNSPSRIGVLPSSSRIKPASSRIAIVSPAGKSPNKSPEKGDQNRVQDKVATLSKPIIEDITESGVHIICPTGDLIILVQVNRNNVTEEIKFRVCSASLRKESVYFNVMLQPDQFQEGRLLAASKGTFIPSQPPPLEALPVITIEDIGRISNIKSVNLLMIDVFKILHGKEIARSSVPLSNLANMVVVADRFDALQCLANYARTKNLYGRLDSKLFPNQSAASTISLSTTALTSLDEDRINQQAYISLNLSHAPWFYNSTLALIMNSTTSIATEHEADEDSPMWHDLPITLRDELTYRRQCILSTISSIQDYFLQQYMSSTKRQCRNGDYACDLFQLGQMVRFFSKIATLDISRSLLLNDTTSSHQRLDKEWNINRLIESLRSCPEYQIDNYHQHCGLRVKLLPCLTVLQEAVLQAGLCLDCWKSSNRWECAWTGAKGPLIWKVGTNNVDTVSPCGKNHGVIRDMFMAVDRIWENDR